MTKEEALAFDLALEALEGVVKNCWRDIPSWRLDEIKERITAIKQARSAPVQEPTDIWFDKCFRSDPPAAQPAPVQEPVGEVIGTNASFGKIKDVKTVKWLVEPLPAGTKLYTTPPAAQPAPVQEPVAWTVSGKITDWSKDFSAYQTKHYTRPVYTPPAAPVQDAEGENKAVRSFLMLYGQPGLTVGQMKKHMAMSGFKSWPAWVETEHDGAHLTKAGAQLWIRHLFALEVTPPAAPVQEPDDSDINQIHEANAQVRYETWTPAAQPAPAPTSWMEMVTVNLLREGVNKHKARELAEHFYGLAPAQTAPVQEPVESPDDWSDWKVTPPAARPAVPLTDEQIESLLPDDDTPMSLGEAFVKFARLVEAAHGITEKGQS